MEDKHRCQKNEALIKQGLNGGKKEVKRLVYREATKKSSRRTSSGEGRKVLFRGPPKGPNIANKGEGPAVGVLIKLKEHPGRGGQDRSTQSGVRRLKICQTLIRTTLKIRLTGPGGWKWICPARGTTVTRDFGTQEEPMGKGIVGGEFTGTRR